MFQLCFSYNKGAAHAANQQQCGMEFHSSLTLSCYFLLLQRTVLQMEFRSNLAILTAIIFISFQVVASVLKIYDEKFIFSYYFQFLLFGFWLVCLWKNDTFQQDSSSSLDFVCYDLVSFSWLDIARVSTHDW